jgi:hypothetical protein
MDRLLDLWSRELVSILGLFNFAHTDSSATHVAHLPLLMP